jgi:signal transduction histidine kinase
VFFNVVKNAMEAMEAGGRLKVRVRSDDDHLHLHFADSGSGIRGEDVGRLFQPFHTTKSSGNGLGLMIVERILRAHGGLVGIDSQEGVGTVVTLSLPLQHRRVRLLGS